MSTKRKKKSPKYSFRKKLLLFGAVCLAVLAIFIGSALFWLYSPVFSKGKPIPFEISSGTSAKNVIAQLNQQDVQISDPLFSLLVRLSGSTYALRAGPYELRAGESPMRLLEKITNGVYAFESVTLVEGWTFHQMRRAIDHHPELNHETADLSDSELLKKLGITQASGEGLFFPDTYLFRKNASDMQVWIGARDAMKKRLNSLWEQRDPQLPYKTPYEALTMASIVEKETANSEDRPMVAAVFVNRLNIGMKLQTDPTVIYGMGKNYHGKIRKADLRTDTPYNTYTRNGLPPTPISMPSMPSLEAAFHPAKIDALFFVSRGDGTSHFTTNLHEHNQAVDKYILSSPSQSQEPQE